LGLRDPAENREKARLGDAGNEPDTPNKPDKKIAGTLSPARALPENSIRTQFSG